MKKIFLLLLLSAILTVSVQAQEDNKAEQMNVMMKMLSLKNGLLGKDSVALSNVLADDVSYGHSTGLIQTKAQLIHAVMSGEQMYKTIDPSDMIIRIYDNTAVITMKSKVNLTMQGKQLDLNMNVLLIWIKKQNDWKLVARQSVKNN